MGRRGGATTVSIPYLLRLVYLALQFHFTHTHTHTVHPPTHTPLPSPSAAVYVVFTLLRASGHTECTRAAYCRPPGGPACFGLIVIMSSMRMIVTAASVAKRICFSFESAGSTTPF